MSNQTTLAVLAIFIGLTLGALLFLPFVAVSYRRRGQVTLGRTVLWVAAVVYFQAIWIYTLAPLPDPADIQCVGAILDPMATVRDVEHAFQSPGSPLRKPELLQVVLNVLLFMPFGFFVRVLGNRGVVISLLTGFGISLLVELTQLTGVWGLYPCAYRFFDVGDLMTNTTGAVLGSVVGLIVPARYRGLEVSLDPDTPRPVTRGRRALAMLCDWFGFTLLSGALAVMMQLGLHYLASERQDLLNSGFSGTVSTLVAGSVWLALILATGRSVGDLAVQVRYTGSTMPQVAARLLRWLGGIAGITVIGLAGTVGPVVSSLLFVTACVSFFFTRNGRGLPGVLSGQELQDAREPRDSSASDLTYRTAE